MLLSPFPKRVEDRPTDRQTDRPIDRPIRLVIEATFRRLKSWQCFTENEIEVPPSTESFSSSSISTNSFLAPLKKLNEQFDTNVIEDLQERERGRKVSMSSSSGSQMEIKVSLNSRNLISFHYFVYCYLTSNCKGILESNYVVCNLVFHKLDEIFSTLCF